VVVHDSLDCCVGRDFEVLVSCGWCDQLSVISVASHEWRAVGIDYGSFVSCNINFAASADELTSCIPVAPTPGAYPGSWHIVCSLFQAGEGEVTDY